VNYDEFKTAFLQALQESGLPTIGGRPAEEILDLSTTDRTVKVSVEPVRRASQRPFHISGVISWRWDALQTARTTTTEEDLLTELLGRAAAEGVATERPWLRVDLELRAGLEPGQSIPLPSPATWATWHREATSRLRGAARLVPDDASRETAPRTGAVLAWQGEPEIHVTGTSRGELRLQSLTLAAFQGIDLRRQWDDPERPRDDDPGAPLTATFRRVRAALSAWAELVDHLVEGPARRPLVSAASRTDSCPFCQIRPASIVSQGPGTVTIRDAYPVSPGHMLVVLTRHVASFFEASADEQAAMLAGVREAKRALDAELHPDGYNVGVNVGSAAGQTVNHVHVHVIPRFTGDVPDPRGGVRHCIPGRGSYERT
jgi:diadenosine tetraphosphate (Ap4A) HIT family hydrolase